jgi:hypothetical protein
MTTVHPTPKRGRCFEPHADPWQLKYSDEKSRTFVFGDEDHTLGNALRHVLMCR